MQTFGPLRIGTVETNIIFISKHHFGGVMVLGEYLVRRNIAPQREISIETLPVGQISLEPDSRSTRLMQYK